MEYDVVVKKLGLQFHGNDIPKLLHILKEVNVSELDYGEEKLLQNMIAAAEEAR